MLRIFHPTHPTAERRWTRRAEPAEPSEGTVTAKRTRPICSLKVPTWKHESES